MNPFAELHDTLHNEKCLLSYSNYKIVQRMKIGENCIFGMFLSESIYKKKEEKRKKHNSIHFQLFFFTLLQGELFDLHFPLGYLYLLEESNIDFVVGCD